MKKQKTSRNGISRNLFIATVIGVIAAAALVAYITLSRSETALSAAASRQISQVSDSTLTLIQSWVENRRTDVSIWAGYSSVRDYFRENPGSREISDSISEELQVLKKSFGWYEDIAVAEPNGWSIAHTNRAVAETVNIVDREYFKAAMSGKIFISGALVSRGTGNPVFIISAPVTDGDRVVGIVYAVVDIKSFTEQFITPIQIGKTGYVYLYDAAGQMLANPVEERILNFDFNEYDWGREILANLSGKITYVLDDVQKYVEYKRDPVTGWGVATSIATSEIEEPVKAMEKQILLIVIPGAFLIAAVILLIISTLLKPLRKVSEVMTGISQGQADLILQTGPHLGGFNQAISVPELIRFTAVTAAECVLRRFRYERQADIGRRSAPGLEAPPGSG